MELSDDRVHHTSEKSVKFKTYKLFTYEIFYLIFFRLQLAVGNGNWEMKSWIWGDNCR